MKKLIVSVALVALAMFGAVGGGIAYRALNGGDADGVLAASQDQQDALSSAWLGAQIVRGVDGLTVGLVIADSPADKAGLQRGDVIKAVDGAQVSDLKALLAALKDKKPGDTVVLSISRGGSALDVTVTLEARPEPVLRAHPVFPELNGIPRDEMFSHMLGGSFQFTDKDGAKHTVTVELGTVSAVDTTAKTITVDLNSGGSKTYTVADGVLTVPNDISKFQSGDKVAATSVDGSLRAIAKGGKLMGHMGGMPRPGIGKGGMRDHMGGGGRFEMPKGAGAGGSGL